MRKYEITVDGKEYKIAVNHFTSEEVDLEVNGKPMKVKVSSIVSDSFITSAPARRSATASGSAVPAQSAPSASASAGEGGVSAPIPGLILEVFVKVGDKVTAGQALLKMEAMKMENAINAPHAGTVTAIKVKAGDAVNQGQELIVVA